MCKIKRQVNQPERTPKKQARATLSVFRNAKHNTPYRNASLLVKTDEIQEKWSHNYNTGLDFKGILE